MSSHPRNDSLAFFVERNATKRRRELAEEGLTLVPLFIDTHLNSNEKEQKPPSILADAHAGRKGISLQTTPNPLIGNGPTSVSEVKHSTSTILVNYKHDGNREYQESIRTADYIDGKKRSTIPFTSTLNSQIGVCHLRTARC